MTTPTSWSSGTLVLQSNATINNWTGGEIYLSNAGFTDNTMLSGRETLVSVGNDAVSITGQMPSQSVLSVWNAGTLGGVITPNGNTVEIAGYGRFDATVNINPNGQASGGTVIFDEPDNGPTILIGEARGVIDYAQLTFLQESSGVTLNDGFGIEGSRLPAGTTPNQEAHGELPTIEIDNLATLKSISLSQTNFTLDFSNGSTVSLGNIHVNDPKYFTAEQTPSGTLYLSESGLPAVSGSHAIPIHAS